ncbi:MAG: NPCBM/NEW2 domain-containing protein, partial [Candidatus Omnitrophica bacterium]|nr:NPCBM/NEW2 domain-containing protein [Candidatus Omnitrophota bacterium]
MLTFLSLSLSSWAATSATSATAQCESWVHQNLGPIKPVAVPLEQTDHPKAGLIVIENHGPILINGRPDGRPLKIGNSEFKQGLICHASSKVTVRLPVPGKSFSARVGVDANAGGGSVVFSVVVGGYEAFKSGVMKGSQAGVPVSVDLGGVSEFMILAGDAGDGIACDHADWAEAKVTLADGRELWLSNLPVIPPQPPQRWSSAPPFSFVYNGKVSDELLPSWQFIESTEKLDRYRTRRTQVYTDPKTGLQARVVVVSYNDFPTVEWTLYFKNTGTADSPILENIQALDTRFECPDSKREFLLHHFTGSVPREDDFAPLTTSLGPNAEQRFTGAAGRPTGTDLCYFNLETADNQGLIIALGWPGQWAADFNRDASRGLRVLCGQEWTHLKLHPNEEVRTPLVALQFWQGGDWIDAQNTWRQWMIAHNMPHPEGKPVAPQFGACAGSYLPRASDEIAQIDGYLKDGVTLDHWIIDAGWYPCNGNWVNTGTWKVDQTRFPKGLREVADHLHAQGIQFIVWFEPERAASGSWLARHHPEWILGDGTGGLVNLGDPEARKWIMERIGQMLVSEGIDVYRSDYNIDPLPYWRNHDAPDRQGVTENLY